MTIEDGLGELFVNDANNRRVASVNVPPRPSPWRGVLAFTGAAVIVGIVILAAILALRAEPQAAAPTVTASSVPNAASTAPTASVAASTSPAPVAVGTVTGALGYPSEGIPPLAVYALPTNNVADGRYLVLTERSDRTITYTLQLPSGTYYLVAYVRDAPAGNKNGGAYTKYVTCGLQPPCSDHTLLPVTVTAGQGVTGIDIRDWYAGPDAYPARPAS